MPASDRPFYLRNCTRPMVGPDDKLCFCPDPKGGRSVRQILGAPFINSWVGDHWMRRAAEAAADLNRTDKALFALLWEIEYAANDAYGMWRNTL